MTIANTTTSYGTVTKTFHWLTAALILAIIPLGLIGTRAPTQTPEEIARVFTLFSLHKTLGVTVFFVAILRIGWAITQVKPGALHPERKRETFLAETVHWLLYGSLVIAPLTGWIHHAALDGFAPIWWPFGQSLPLVPKDEGVAHFFENLHWIFTKVMVASILLHVAGALKHHVIDKDATLIRMWFGSGPMPDAPAHRSPAAAPLAAAAIFVIAGVGISAASGSTADVRLTQVQSDWAVQDGTIEISVTQLGNEISGQFSDWTSQISFDPDAAPDHGNVTTTINIGSLSLGSVTDQAMGADFFNVEGFPTALFTADLRAAEDGNYLADGSLTLKGTTIPVQMPFTLEIDGNIATVTGSATLNRRDFAIGETTDDSTLGPDVNVAISLQATRSTD